MDLAQLGATEKGGVCRLALTELDGQARDLFVAWCQAEGCSIRIDRIGNIFARRAGSRDDLPAIATGNISTPSPRAASSTATTG